MTGKKKETAFSWNKGAKTETVHVGEAALTYRGLSYYETLLVESLEDSDGNILSLRLATVGVKGLVIDGKEFVAEYEDYEFGGRKARVLTDASFDMLYEHNLMILKQAIALVIELTTLAKGEADAVKFRRATK